MLIKSSVINSWATAIVNIAIEEKKVSQYIEQTNAIVDLLKENPEFIALLSVHQSSDATRVKIIDNVFTKADFDTNIINALKLMVISDLIFNARDIFKNVRKKLAEHNDILFGVVWSISELDGKTLSTIEENISKKINQKVKLVNKVDKTILGGVQVIVKGQKFDGSIKGKLLDMKSSILNMNNIEN